MSVQNSQVLLRLARGREQRVSQTARLGAQRMAISRQHHEYLPLVFRIACPVHQPRLLQALQQWRERAGLESQLFGDDADTLPILAPEHVEHEILRIGEPKFIQQRLVGTLDRHVRGVDRIAKLIVERDWRSIPGLWLLQVRLLSPPDSRSGV